MIKSKNRYKESAFGAVPRPKQIFTRYSLGFEMLETVVHLLVQSKACSPRCSPACGLAWCRLFPLSRRSYQGEALQLIVTPQSPFPKKTSYSTIRA